MNDARLDGIPLIVEARHSRLCQLHAPCARRCCCMFVQAGCLWCKCETSSGAGSRRTWAPPGVVRQCACKLTGGVGAQTPVTCKGPSVDYKRSLAAAAPVFKQARSSALPVEGLPIRILPVQALRRCCQSLPHKRLFTKLLLRSCLPTSVCAVCRRRWRATSACPRTSMTSACCTAWSGRSQEGAVCHRRTRQMPGCPRTS